MLKTYSGVMAVNGGILNDSWEKVLHQNEIDADLLAFYQAEERNTLREMTSEKTIHELRTLERIVSV